MSVMNRNVKVGQIYIDTDLRNADTGKTGKAKPKPRVVKIIALPTLGSPGVMEVMKAPKQPKTVGALRRFTFGKLAAFYSLVG